MAVFDNPNRKIPPDTLENREEYIIFFLFSKHVLLKLA
jgi:hypothetical protein